MLKYMLLNLIAAGDSNTGTDTSGGTTGTNAAGRASQAQGGLSNVGGTTDNDLEANIGLIINAIIGFVAIVAVIVIIIGGINYTMSQGDPQKTKKAKDTILYGVIGLIITLLAFAIVNFVLNALQG